MINNDRIVQVTATDLLSLYALMLKLSGKTLSVLDASTTNGQFVVNGTNVTSGSTVIASEPVATMNIASDYISGTTNIYFVPAYDYTGFTLDNNFMSTSGDAVVPDGRSLYLATISGSGVKITQQGV